jgi:ATP-dependent DNA helicase RecG
MDILHQPVTSLAGVGSYTANRLANLGIVCLQDVLFHLPLRYEDRTQIYPIAALQAGMVALVCAQVESADISPWGRKALVCRVSDGTGCLELKFFHYSPRQYSTLQPGVCLSCFAEVREGYHGLEMVHPELTVIPSLNSEVAESCMTAIYPLTEGINQGLVRKLVAKTFAVCNQNPTCLTDYLLPYRIRQLGLTNFTDALWTLHYPDDVEQAKAIQTGTASALKALAFEELLAHHLVLRSAKARSEAWQAPSFCGNEDLIVQFFRHLPFNLTHAQDRVINDIATDCQRRQPMMRLVQGDVGSGKTVVAAFAAVMALTSGYQVAVMAPTELLAEQHHKNFSQWLAVFPHVQVALLTGQVKGQARQKLLQQLQNHSVHVAVGTHALFQETVQFDSLGLIIIDEQHRFGVHQRLALREKGQQDSVRPHQLIMTATPIPRTLAMLQYSDLDVSVIDELPPGRTPVVTVAMASERRKEVIARIENWVSQQRQVYWVCTLVEESELLQAEAAEKTAANLAVLLPNVRIGLVHGRMKANDKAAVMAAFKNRQTDVLVATTVIEVGVDVPNANLMVIENPERLGLSQLHQLRGRVGRGSQDSYCVLLYQNPLTETARIRLGILRDHHDGFTIAEKDLELRGPGEILGVRQTGALQFKVANLQRDADLVPMVEEVATELFTAAPHHIQPLCDRWLGVNTDYAEV